MVRRNNFTKLERLICCCPLNQSGNIKANRRWRRISDQMSKKLGYCRSCTVSIVLAFHKHNSLPLGHIRAFISFYYRASWKQLSAATEPEFSHFFTFNVGIKKGLVQKEANVVLLKAHLGTNIFVRTKFHLNSPFTSN